MPLFDIDEATAKELYSLAFNVIGQQFQLQPKNLEFMRLLCERYKLNFDDLSSFNKMTPEESLEIRDEGAEPAVALIELTVHEAEVLVEAVEELEQMTPIRSDMLTLLKKVATAYPAFQSRVDVIVNTWDYRR